jgi:hypothetical protein
MATKADDKPTTSALLPWSTPTVTHVPQAQAAAANLVGEGSLKAKVMRNARIVEDLDDVVGQGYQTRRVQQALGRLRAAGIVLEELSRPDLRAHILADLADEARRTGASDEPPSRQVMDRELIRLGLR